MLSIADDFTRPGALRAAAERIAKEVPDFFCLHGIEAGDAFATATRFDCEWAYRGAQALFWRSAFHAREVHDRYLPGPLLRPFERRGLLEVDGEVHGTPLTLIATQLSNDRSRIREMRFVRSVMRRSNADVLLFVAGFDPNAQRYGFDDLRVSRVITA